MDRITIKATIPQKYNIYIGEFLFGVEAGDPLEDPKIKFFISLVMSILLISILIISKQYIIHIGTKSGLLLLLFLIIGGGSQEGSSISFLLSLQV